MVSSYCIAYLHVLVHIVSLSKILGNFLFKGGVMSQVVGTPLPNLSSLSYYFPKKLYQYIDADVHRGLLTLGSS